LERNPYLTPIQQRVLCVHIAHAGVPLGETIPERAAVEWLGEEGPQEAGCSPRAFKDARAVLLAHGLLAKERREPGARSKTGRPWDQWYVLGAAINGRWETLGQPPAAEEVAPDEGDADAEEVAIRPRPRTRARQRSRERDRARRLQVAADRARMKDLEAQNETLPQELRRATACRGCGTLIDAEQWHCDACREAQDPDAHGAHAAQLPAQPAGAFRRKE
jgi:hypothetical protein